MNNIKMVIGLDFGSDSVRGILVNCLDGQILKEAEYSYRRWGNGQYCSVSESEFRQHPQDYLDGMLYVLRNLVSEINSGNVLGIGLDTTGSTVCPVDCEGMPLALHQEFADDPDGMFYLWKDHSAIGEAEEINHMAGQWREDYRKYTGGRYSSEWFWSKILHGIRHNSKVTKAAFSWVEHCDWITGELTGMTDPLSMKRSVCAAGHKAMWHPDWNGFPPEEFLTAIDARLGILRSRLGGRIQTSDQACGKLCPKWAELCGLSTDTIISTGQLDCHAGAVGAGIEPGKLVKVIGTSTCDIAVTEPGGKLISGICGQVAGSVLPGKNGLEAGQAAFGDVYRWFQKFMGTFGQELPLSLIEEKTSALPMEAAHSLLALDWFNGRRSPDVDEHLAGALFGLKLNSTPEMVYQALVQATCCGARKIVERFQENGLKICSITAVGGIARKSSYVMQTMADILNMPIEVLNSPQACALGSAMNAAAAAGIFPDLTSAMKALNPGCDKIYRPSSAMSQGQLIYQRYIRAADLVEKLSTEL